MDLERNHLVSAAALVRNGRGEILLVKSPLRGWEYPGGLIEPGETIQEALRREIREESGVEAEITGFAGVSKNLTHDIVNLDFTARYVSGELRTSEESTEVRWATAEEAFALITFPLTAKRLENMLARDGRVACFNFIRTPFSLREDEKFTTLGEPSADQNV